MQPIPVPATTYAVTSTNTTIGPIVLNGQGGSLRLRLNNTSGTATNTLVLNVQGAPGDPFDPLLTNTDFGTATTRLIDSSVSPPPQAITANSVAWFDFACLGANAINLIATTASGTATIVMSGGASWSMT